MWFQVVTNLYLDVRLKCNTTVRREIKHIYFFFSSSLLKGGGKHYFTEVHQPIWHWSWEVIGSQSLLEKCCHANILKCFVNLWWLCNITKGIVNLTNTKWVFPVPGVPWNPVVLGSRRVFGSLDFYGTKCSPAINSRLSPSLLRDKMAQPNPFTKIPISPCICSYIMPKHALPFYQS